jgi:hypothetical protein
MFYHLLYPLASDVSAFNVFRYITFRTGAATLTALFIAFMVGPPLIRTPARWSRGGPWNGPPRGCVPRASPTTRWSVVVT